MKMAKIITMAIIFLVSGFAFTINAFAEPQHPGRYMDHHMGIHGDWPGHGFSGYCNDDNNWKNDLSDNQQKEIEKARLAYLKKKDLIKAKLKQAKVEFATLLTSDSPSQDAINKKIDEIAKLNSQKLRTKADYKIQIRKALNADQRVKFDMSLMNHATRDKKGYGHGHGW